MANRISERFEAGADGVDTVIGLLANIGSCVFRGVHHRGSGGFGLFADEAGGIGNRAGHAVALTLFALVHRGGAALVRLAEVALISRPLLRALVLALIRFRRVLD